MSTETYTFACPVCAVRLSVPKALAGVRGPCPQCHHEITSPEVASPEREEALVIAGGADRVAAESGESMADRVAAGESERRYPPPLPGVSGGASVEDAVMVPPVAEGDDAAAELTEDLVEQVPAAVEPVVPPPRRRSGGRWAVASLAFLVVGGLAAFNFLPAQTLRGWVQQALPGAAVAWIFGEEPDEDNASTAVEIRPAGDAVAPLDEVGDEAASAPHPGAATADPAVGPEPPAARQVGGGTSSAPIESGAVERGRAGIPRPARVAGAPADPTLLLPDISESAEPSAAVVLDEQQAGAQEALTLFLEARTWNDRLLFSEGSESLEAEMEAYYRTTRDGPHSPTSVDYLASAPLADGDGAVHVFHVTFADLPQGFPVPVRQTADGWKIDWPAFVEFREGKLKNFLSDYHEAPAVFRVRMQRAQYLDRSVPNADKKYAFRVAAPIDGHEGHVFVDQQDSIVGPKLESMLDWNAPPSLVMVKLKWVRGNNGRGYVELRDIVSDSWRPTPPAP